ncbi:MAG: hypothetical protein D6691_12555 [Candidatus Hydrogenedentota bacterium]|nr:MAG: hypothetical protein D6691_12555 [Candidatus Hydrogenedentota bacterium]
MLASRVMVNHTQYRTTKGTLKMAGKLASFWVLLVLGICVASECRAQAERRSGRSSDSAVGPSRKAQKIYDKYAQQWSWQDGYELSPFIVTQIETPVAKPLGPTRRLTELEYSRLILSTLAVPPLEPLPRRSPVRSVVQPETGEDGVTRYKPVETRVVEVFNRGILLLENGEEVRLRGVRMFSERDPDDVIRYYVREGMRRLRELTRTQRVRIVFEEPLRDPDGNLLGLVTLADGTELNRYMLEQGYGYVEPADFLPFQDLSEYYTAERTARDARRGIWSKK